MTRVWFMVPVHGREALTEVCLRQLKRTCDAAWLAYDIQATAVVIGDDRSLQVAADLGFATVRRDNHQLGRKFNDGYQLACDPAYNPEPADYCVPCGSDDWVDPVILRRMPPPDAIGNFRQITVVNEGRTVCTSLKVAYSTGAGIRIIPASLIARAGYRPAHEEARRAVDASTQYGISEALRGHVPRTVYLDVHAAQIVDWKSHGQQLNSYAQLRGFRRGNETDVWETLEPHYPAEALDEMLHLTPSEVAPNPSLVAA